MSQPSTQHLRDLVPGENRENFAKESIGRIVIYGLPQPYRGEFFPEAYIVHEENAIGQQSPEFVEAAAVHLVVQRLAQYPKISSDVKSRINQRKAALFFDVCVSREPPPSPQADPVVQYGWDRKDDAQHLRKLQDECAQVFLKCDRLGYVRATPAIDQYLSSEPAEWYSRLAKHLTSAGYKNDFVLKMMGGVKQVRDVLLDFFIKLTLLHDAANGHDLKPEPQDVVAELCTKIGLPALDMADVNDATKEEIRNLLETIQELEKTHRGFGFHFILYGVLDVDFALKLPEIFHKIMNTGNFLDRLLASIVLGLAGPLIEWVINKMAEAELNKRVGDFLSGPGQKYGLCN